MRFHSHDSSTKNVNMSNHFIKFNYISSLPNYHKLNMCYTVFTKILESCCPASGMFFLTFSFSQKVISLALLEELGTALALFLISSSGYFSSPANEYGSAYSEALLYFLRIKNHYIEHANTES